MPTFPAPVINKRVVASVARASGYEPAVSRVSEFAPPYSVVLAAALRCMPEVTSVSLPIARNVLALTPVLVFLIVAPLAPVFEVVTLKMSLPAAPTLTLVPSSVIEESPMAVAPVNLAILLVLPEPVNPPPPVVKIVQPVLVLSPLALM